MSVWLSNGRKAHAFTRVADYLPVCSAHDAVWVPDLAGLPRCKRCLAILARAEAAARRKGVA